MRRQLGRPLFLAVVLLLTASRHRALAHSFDPAVLDLREREAGVFHVVWKLPATEAGAQRAGEATIRPEFPVHCRQVDRAPTDMNVDSPAYWQVDCRPSDLRGESLSVSGLDGGHVDVIVRITWLDGTTESTVLRSGATDFEVPRRVQAGVAVSGAPMRAVLWSYLRLGVAHILLGVDHLLFVLGLLLLVGSWQMLVKTISAFTVAHSVALALATLNIVQIPPAPVEALIAMSIVLVAIELTRAPGAPATLTRHYPWAVAFAFGLVHGLGFAGALAEIGLPPDQIALALVAFNVGVEIGQLAFVAAMVLPLRGMDQMIARWPQLRLLPSYGIGSLAVAWTIERVQRFWAPWG